MKILIRNGIVVNEGRSFPGGILIENEHIHSILKDGEAAENAAREAGKVFDAKGAFILPGLIDDQVHFREPGLTHKAEILTESKAAVAGGITSYMEMPNTVPNTLTQELLEQKYTRASEVSSANYSFFMGVSNGNLPEVLKTDPRKVCGVKVFMGSSTGNMLVDDANTLEALFRECRVLIAAHCEDEATIRHNMEVARTKYGDAIPINMHPVIRDAEACYRSSSRAVEMASKYGTRLHVLHISSAKETSLFKPGNPVGKLITAEACVHHLWFTQDDYAGRGNLIKWNPSVKSQADRDALWDALLEGRIDVLATDHAPHTLEEKQQNYLKAPSGGPLVQHALPALMECAKLGRISVEGIAMRYAHNPAICFQIEKRGFIRPGYYADLVLVHPDAPWEVSRENILYKCGWSPFEGIRFGSKVLGTFVNGNLVYDNFNLGELGIVHPVPHGKRLTFAR